ncbi:hypothetical protein EBU99_08705 [bacterium]|nr:hypothetical protein [bacterium]
MLTRNIRLGTLGLFTAAALIAGSCGKKKSSGGDESKSGGATFAISGQLALGSTLNLEAASAPNTIYAIPANTIENIYSFSKENLKTFSVGSDGKFSANIDASKGDYLLVAVDSTASNRLDGVRGVLSLKDDSGSLMRIPAAEGKGSVDMGTMSADGSGKEYTSAKKTDDVASSFSLDLSKMKELARTDDSARQLINVVANIKDNGDYFFAKPYMVFNANIQKLNGVASAATDFSYNGYGLYFISKWTGVKPEDFCNGSSAAHKIELTPPANATLPTLCKKNNDNCADKVSYATLSNLNTGALVSEGGSRSSCYSSSYAADGQFYIAKESRPGGFEGPFGFNWGGGGYNGQMPAGQWVLKLDGSEVGRYDLAAASPLNASSKITVYIPSVKAVSNASGTITTLEVEWYLLNAAGQYEKLTDTSSLVRNAREIGYEIANYSNGCSSKALFNQFSNTSATPMTADVSSFAAAMPPSSGSWTGCKAESIAITYTMNGVSYRFDYRPWY